MGGPNSINSNNSIRGGGFIPRQAPAPDLKKFALTIDDFRQFASGKYNAGAAPGGRATGVHRTWERLESEDLDPSEAASIRLAFAFALEGAGVSGDKMAAACKRLGLEADFSFPEDGAKVYTSLSREEVRDIIAQSLDGKPGRTEPPKAKKTNIIEIDDSLSIREGDDKIELIEKEPEDELNIIDDIRDEPLFKSRGEPRRPSNVPPKKPDIFAGLEDWEIEEKKRELEQAQFKLAAKTNFETIVSAMSWHYDVSKEEIREIIRRVPDWESQLAICQTDGNGDYLRDLNEDLKNFLVSNREIQEGIDELLAQKKEDK